jgi:hypothetical protein
MDSIYKKTFGQDLQDIKDFSRFPEETVKVSSACRWKKPSSTLYIWIEGLAVTRHLFREADRIFPVSSGNREKNPINPVNPVCFL